MKQELYAVLMRNDLNEKCAVLFLSDNLTDAQNKAMRYAKQINGTIVKYYHVPDVHDIQIVTGKGRPKEGN